MKRVGLVFSGVPFTVREIVAYAKLAEKSGFESVWCAEDYFLRDALTPLSCLAFATKRLKVGTSIINPYTRHPALIALTIATIDELSDGRAVLGLGAGVPPLIRMMAPQAKPLRRMRESVWLIRQMLERGEVSFEGATLRVKGIRTGYCPYLEPFGQFKPPRRKIPIYMAGMGPRMLTLAGELGDGVLISVGFSVPHLRKSLEYVAEGARRAGKNPARLDVGCLIGLSPSRSGRVSRPVRSFVAACVTQFFDDETLRLSGLEAEDVRPIRQAFAEGGLQAASEYITKEVVNRFVAAGTERECVSRLNEYAEAGAKLPMLWPLDCEVEAAIRVGKLFAISG